MHCGDLLTLTPGHCSVTGNTVTRMAQYKRTYQSGIHWGGVDNTFSANTVTDSPHNCFLGGGNEVGAVGGVGNLFEFNTLDNCAFESSDTGAFYSCGQDGTAFVNPGNVLRHSTFRNIRSTSTAGVQDIQVQAVYLGASERTAAAKYWWRPRRRGRRRRRRMRRSDGSSRGSGAEGCLI